MEKLLTIIIPTYNAEQYLEKTLESLHVQDDSLFQRLDILVIDDGSPDGSHLIAQQFIERWPEEYRMIRKENGGHGSGINRGVKEATGRYFKVLDADDWVDTEGLESFLRKLENIEADVVVTPFQEYDISTGKITDKISKPEKYGKLYSWDEVMNQWQQIHPDMNFWGLTYRTAFYRELGYELVEGVFYEDQEYATVPASYASSIVFLNDMVYVYRVGDANQSVYGDTQVKRRSHLEVVLQQLIEQEANQSYMPDGGARYWRKKTAMVVTSYYQIMLLKNKDKKMGRAAVKELNLKLQKQAPDIMNMTAKKCKGFLLFSYLHVSNHMYEVWAPKILGCVRKIKGQKV